MNEYKVQVLVNACVEGQHNVLNYSIKADRLLIEENIYKFYTIDQIRNREVLVATFPIDNTIVIKN